MTEIKTENEIETPTETYIPNDEEVATPVRSMTYRFSKGEIVTGRSEDNNLIKKEKLVGQLKRVFVHIGKTKDGSKDVGQIEADLLCNPDGLVRLKANILDANGKLQPGSSAFSFAEALLDLAKDEIIVATAALSTKKNAHGTYGTYANLYHWKGKGIPAVATKRQPKSNDNSTPAERWERLVDQLKAHPAWAERPVGVQDDDPDHDDDSNLAELIRECKQKGWPHPEQATEAWLGIMQRFCGLDAPKTTLADHSEDDWLAARQAIGKATTMPQVLQDFLAAQKAQPASETSDPFASKGAAPARDDSAFN